MPGDKFTFLSSLTTLEKLELGDCVTFNDEVPTGQSYLSVQILLWNVRENIEGKSVGGGVMYRHVKHHTTDVIADIRKYRAAGQTETTPSGVWRGECGWTVKQSCQTTDKVTAKFFLKRLMRNAIDWEPPQNTVDLAQKDQGTSLPPSSQRRGENISVGVTHLCVYVGGGVTSCKTSDWGVMSRGGGLKLAKVSSSLNHGLLEYYFAPFSKATK